LRWSNQKKQRDPSGSKAEIVELIPDDDDGVFRARASSLIMLRGS
jgi:hypothetical protein